MENYTTILKLLPVCSCGHVFREGLVVHKDILETNGWKYSKNFILPNTCPNCKKEIECIEHNNNYEFVD